LGPAAVEEADFAFLGARVSGCGFDNPAVHVEIHDSLFAVLLQ
jgi:hypothetical protein